MGKYMRKAKITGDVAVTESSSLGVRTRAKTLALQLENNDSCYLQLRSRRLEKPPPTDPKKPSKETCHEDPVSDSAKKSNPKSNSRFCGIELESSFVGSDSVIHSDAEDGYFSRGVETEDGYDLGPEFSIGENNLDSEARARCTRESTPCSSVREADTAAAPGSSTRQTNLNTAAQRISNSIPGNMPSSHEMEEFFAFAEQQQQCHFMEKYNFDVVKDVPLTGRYEWIRVDH